MEITDAPSLICRGDMSGWGDGPQRGVGIYSRLGLDGATMLFSLFGSSAFIVLDNNSVY